MEKKSLLRITYPIFIELSLVMLMSTVDTLMLSGLGFEGLKGVGDDAVGAVGTASILLNFVVTVANFITIGLLILVAQYVGAKRKEELDKVMYSGMVAGLFAGVVLFLAIFLLSEPLLNMINADAAHYHYANQYLKILSVSLVFMTLVNVNSSIYKGHGFTNITMRLALIANVLNVLLNAIFIFGLFGVPQLGVVGVAWATVISRFMMYVISSILMARKVRVRLSLAKLKLVKLKYIVKILLIGVPAAFEGMAYTFLHMMALRFVNGMQMEADIAATTRSYIMTITSFIFNFSIAIGQANQILVGQHVGSQELDLAYKRTMKSLKINTIITLSLSVGLYFISEPILRFFTDNARIIELGKKVLLADILLELARSFNIILGNALKSCGDNLYTFVFSVGITLIIGLSASYLNVIVLNLGLIGAWLGIATEALFRSTAFYIRFKSKRWYKHKIIID
jgi:putative MATE family efflux protein